MAFSKCKKFLLSDFWMSNWKLTELHNRNGKKFILCKMWNNPKIYWLIYLQVLFLLNENAVSVVKTRRRRVAVDMRNLWNVLLWTLKNLDRTQLQLNKNLSTSSNTTGCHGSLHDSCQRISLSRKLQMHIT